MSWKHHSNPAGSPSNSLLPFPQSQVPLAYDSAATQGDLHLRSVTYLLPVLREVLHITPCTSPPIDASDRVKKWVRFLDQIATLLVRSPNAVFATTASISYDKKGVQHRQIVYTCNSGGNSAPNEVRNRPYLTKSVHNEYPWAIFTGEWAATYLSKGCQISTEEHASHLEFFLTKLQETVLEPRPGASSSVWSGPEDTMYKADATLRKSEILDEMGAYIHVICRGKICQRLNYNIPIPNMKIRFRTIFDQITPEALRKHPHIDSHGDTYDPTIVNFNFIPEKILQQGDSQLMHFVSAFGFYIPADPNNPSYLHYTQDTMVRFHVFVRSVIDAVDHLEEQLKEAIKNKDHEGVALRGKHLYKTFYIFGCLSTSRALWLHVRHTAFSRILSAAPSSAQVGPFASPPQSRDVSNEDEDPSLLPAEDLQHGSPQGAPELILKWFGICSAHCLAVLGASQVANRKLSPKSSPTKGKENQPGRDMPRSEATTKVSEENQQVPTPPPPILTIQGISFPCPPQRRVQNDLLETLSTLLERFPRAFEGIHPPAVIAEEIGTAGSTMSAYSLAWFLKTWATDTIPQMLEENSCVKSLLELLSRINIPLSRANDVSMKGDAGEVNEPLDNEWTNSFEGAYHCESVLGALIYRSKRVRGGSAAKTDTALLDTLCRMQPMIGVSQQPCSMCLKYMKELDISIASAPESNFTDPGTGVQSTPTQTDIESTHTRSTHGQLYGWAAPPTAWGLSQTVLSKLTNSAEQDLLAALKLIIKSVQAKLEEARQAPQGLTNAASTGNGARGSIDSSSGSSDSSNKNYGEEGRSDATNSLRAVWRRAAQRNRVFYNRPG